MSAGMPFAAGDQDVVPPVVPQSGEVDLGRFHLTAPKEWVRKAPRSGMIVAEFALPRAEGDKADGRLTISMARGTVQANVDRWRSQFPPKPEKEAQEKLQVSGIELTLVDLSGTFEEPFASAPPVPGYRMLGTVCPLEPQSLFIKAYGPEKTMAKHQPAFRAFVQSLQPTPVAK